MITEISAWEKSVLEHTIMDDPRELACRMEKLERSIRRLRAVLAVVILLAGMICLVGSSSNQIPPQLEAQRFVLKDATGHERGSLFATDSSWGLVLYNPDSSKGAAFIVSSAGNGALVMNKKGRSGLAAMVSDEANTFSISDVGKERSAIELKSNGQAVGFRLLDDKSIDRVDLTLPRTGEATLLLNDANSRTRAVLQEGYPGLATFDEKGSFVWAAGFDGLPKEDQETIRVLMQKSMPRR